MLAGLGFSSLATSSAALAWSPGAAAETIARAIHAGNAGCSIEDVDREAGALYPLPEAGRGQIGEPGARRLTGR